MNTRPFHRPGLTVCIWRVFAAALVFPAFLPGAPRAWAQASEAPAAVSLRPAFQQGQVARFEIWTLRNRHARMEVPNRQVESTDRLEVTGQMTWTVNRVNADGSADCTMTIDWLATTMTLTPPEGQEVVQRNDSRQGSGDSEAMHRLLQAMAGAPIGVRMNADGSVASVSGVDAVQRRAGEEVPAPDELDFIESASDLATIPGALAQAQINSGWQHSLTTSHQLGKIEAPMTYRLASVEEIAGIRVATVVGQAELRFQPDREKLPEQATLRMTQGQAATQVMFDLSRHEAVGRNSTSRHTLETTAALQGVTIRQTIQEYTQSQALRIAE